MYVPDLISNQSMYPINEDELERLYPEASWMAVDYHKYAFVAVCSASFGLPMNILLLAVFARIGLFSRRRSSVSRLSYLSGKPTGSFERFLFEVVSLDTLLIIYHFVDNFLSYIRGDRSNGQNYLIHVSDFCCKFFTYIAKMSVLLSTWLLLFLIINQLILTMEPQNIQRSFLNRSLYYVNAKYSTVVLVFIFSVYNIYPIEVLKYQKKDAFPDYQKGGTPGVCRPVVEGKSKELLNIANYGYNILGIATPGLIILVLSIIIIYRTCRNRSCTNKEDASLYYIAGTIGIIHSLINLPGRLSDILMLFLPSYYVPFYPYLIKFNHEVRSIITLSHAYKGFVCILISRRFRLHAKSILCFLIENKYEDHRITEIVHTTDDKEQEFKRNKKKKHHHHHHHHHHHYTNPHSSKITASNQTTARKLSFSRINKKDLERYTTSDATSWIRPYFTQHAKRNFLRPCGRSVSYQQIANFPSDLVQSSEKSLPKRLHISTPIKSDFSSSCIINVTMPNGESIHIPLPQKRADQYRSSYTSSSSIKTKTDSSRTTIFTENVEKQPLNGMQFLSTSHVY